MEIIKEDIRVCRVDYDIIRGKHENDTYLSLYRRLCLIIILPIVLH